MKQLFQQHDYGGSPRKLCLFFCAYGVPAWQYNLPGLPIWRLRRAGWRVVAYDYPLAVANFDAHTSLETIQNVVNAALAVAQEIKPERVAVFGVSLGTAAAMQVAATARHVDRVVLNLPWTDLRENIAHIPPMLLLPSWVKRRFISRSGGMEAIAATLAPIEPRLWITRLPSTLQALVWVGRHDKVLRYADGQQYRAALREQLGDRLTLRQVKFTGHYVSALRNNLAHNVYLSFMG